MPRKRKIRVQSDENVAPSAKPTKENASKRPKNQKISAILLQTQESANRHHDKYIKELQKIYEKDKHDDFMSDFLLILRSVMVRDINNEYANNILSFCAKFVAAHNTEETHPLVTHVFNWLLGTSSNDVNVRLRLCEFVNLILKSLGEDAVLDDNICDSIHKYMSERMGDINANIRTQAVLALQRLQVPDDPNDVILKQYFFHLSTDPCVKMRQNIITSIGRNMNTIPPIIERLWDVDEKVRRHVILQMSSYPVRSYKVAERLTFLEQGLNDHSELVRKATTNVMLPRWVDSYGENYIALVGALKLDTNDKEMQRFRKCALQALQHIFKKSDVTKIVTALGFTAPEKTRKASDDEEEEEEEMDTTKKQIFPRCVPFKSLNIEVAVYWEAAVCYLQENDFDELNAILPELSIFCGYLEKYCESVHYEADKWQQMKNQYVLLSLLEILAKYDLGDDFGRSHLKQLLHTILIKYNLEEWNVSVLARMFERVYPIADERLQTVVEIVNEILHLKDSNVTVDSEMESTVLKKADIDLQLKVSALKVKMMDLKEQENAFVQKKDYANAQKATEEWDQCNEEYVKLLHPLLVAEIGDTSDTVLNMDLLKVPQKISTETTLKCLQIIFFTICSKHTNSITPSVVNLYNQFICRHMESLNASVREWAFKCATTCSMLYSMLAKEVTKKLSEQFVLNSNVRVWTIAIECLFELVDRYGLDFFLDAPSEDDLGKVSGKTKSRQLFSNSLLDHGEQDTSQSIVDILGRLSHLLENCEYSCIVQALVLGFCRFVLHGHYTESNIVSKLMLYYFNPATEPEINQILGIFFESLTKERKQEYLQPALLPTLFFIFEAPIDSPLQEIKPETVMKFVIDVTRPQFCSPGLNIHNTIGMSFINAMQDNVTHKELLKILSKGLLSLEVSDDPSFRRDLKNSCDQLLKVTGLDEKVARNIGAFKDLLDGIKRPTLSFSSTRITNSVANAEKNSDEEEGQSDEEEGEKIAENPLETINEDVSEEQNSVATKEKTLTEDLEKTDNAGEGVLVPATPSPRSQSQESLTEGDDSVFLPETQKTPKARENLPQSQISDVSENSEIIDASFDETAVSSRRIGTRTKKILETKTTGSAAKASTAQTSSQKRQLEMRTPNPRTRITRNATSTQSEKKSQVKAKASDAKGEKMEEKEKKPDPKEQKKPEPKSQKKPNPKKQNQFERPSRSPSQRTRRYENKNGNETPISLSQSSSEASIKSGPSTINQKEKKKPDPKDQKNVDPKKPGRPPRTPSQRARRSENKNGKETPISLSQSSSEVSVKSGPSTPYPKENKKPDSKDQKKADPKSQKKPNPKEQKEPERPSRTPSQRARRSENKNGKETPISLSQSSSASSVKSGPSTPKRARNVQVAVTPLSNSYIEIQTGQPRTRRATAEEYSRNNIMTRTRIQHLSPSTRSSSQRSKSSQDSNRSDLSARSRQ